MKINQIAALLQKHHKLKVAKLPPLPAPEVVKRETGCDNERLVAKRYCYHCLQGFNKETRDAESFCSWRCELDYETEVARIKRRRVDILASSLKFEDAIGEPCIKNISV